MVEAGSLFAAQPAWIWAVCIAPFAGSFLGVLIDRLPAGRAVVFARSSCAECGARLGPLDLVPLASFALLRGRCRHCDGRISLFHPAIELSCIAVALWVAAVVSDEWTLWISCILGWTLLALAVSDWRSFVLPDALTLTLLLGGFSVTAWQSWPDLTDHTLAAALGFTVFRGISLLYRRIRGREGLGAGDAKLLAAGGAWLGISPLPRVLLIAALFGLFLAIASTLRGRKFEGTLMLPFGSCLSLAIWLAWLYS